MQTKKLLRAHLRVQVAQKLCRHAMQQFRPSESRTLDRLAKATYILDLARERYVRLAKERPATVES